MNYKTPTCFVLLSMLTTLAYADEVLGLVKEKPDEGAHVETAEGFMVPYKTTIPGTTIEYEMVPIPGGTFTMGSPNAEEGREETEGPQFKVTVEPFWIGKYEIRWEEYKYFMHLYQVFKDFETHNIRKVDDSNKFDAITAPTELYEADHTFEYGEDDKQAAVTITQYAAKQYTKWMTGVTGHFHRLPYEAEWEYACRAGTTTAYFFGDDAEQLGDYAVYQKNSDDDGQKHIGTKKPNPWGLYDMYGNVAEWVLDEVREDGYSANTGKSLSAAESVAWPTKESSRVLKGGCWLSDAKSCRSASRLASDPVPKPGDEESWRYYDPNMPLSPWWYTGNDDSELARGVGFRLFRPLKEVASDKRGKFYDADVEAIQLDVADRLEEGRGVLGIVDTDLPAAIEKLKTIKKKK